MKIYIKPINARKRNQYYLDDLRPEDHKHNVSCTNCGLSHLKITRTGRKSHRDSVPTNELMLDRYCNHLHEVVDITKANNCERYTKQHIFKKL